MKISRRRFTIDAALACAGAAVAQSVATAAEATQLAGGPPLVISTWPFGKAANEAALKVLEGGGALLDAVEQGIWVTESDPTMTSVGLSGGPNAAGVPQLDACIMLGPGHKAGSVAALEGIKHPISVARRVMEKTSHVMLVGEGARMFALEQGLESVKTDSRAKYQAWQKKRKRELAQAAKDPAGAKNHDTLALLVLGADRNVAGGCSTSGMKGKLPGRVGDSPILGSGLYVDNEVGAAGATGIGENVMRHCGSYLVVELMRQGMSPQDACAEAVRRIVRKESSKSNLHINFVALDKKGRFGAAGSSAEFQYAVAYRGTSQVLVPTIV
jgi:N4-(beta-N-acetylglucosaminyl)-L-asparaginase